MWTRPCVGWIWAGLEGFPCFVLAVFLLFLLSAEQPQDCLGFSLLMEGRAPQACSSRQPVSMHCTNCHKPGEPSLLGRKIEKEFFLWSLQDHVHNLVSSTLATVCGVISGGLLCHYKQNVFVIPGARSTDGWAELAPYGASLDQMSDSWGRVLPHVRNSAGEECPVAAHRTVFTV